jgi:hypothetical protein
MANTFAANGRHIINVALNAGTGLCDVHVSDKITNKTFSKSLVLEQYNKLVDYFTENEHAFAIQAAHSIF